MKLATAIVSGNVRTGPSPPPAGAIPPGAAPRETAVIPELKVAQRALGIADDGAYGPQTRDAIREFQTGMYRRNALEWPISEVTGNLTSRSGRTLTVLTAMPVVFMSPFERAWLGNDGGFFGANPLSSIERPQLDSTLNFLGVPPDQVAAASTMEAKMKLFRDRITELRTALKLPMTKGAVLDAQLYREVWKTSPLNVDKTD
jgi:hypothetical protein